MELIFHYGKLFIYEDCLFSIINNKTRIYKSRSIHSKIIKLYNKLTCNIQAVYSIIIFRYCKKMMPKWIE